MEEKQLIDIIERTVINTMSDYLGSTINHSLDSPDMRIPLSVSNRHIHLSKLAVERLFGPDYKLTKLKPLSQPGQYACNETVTLIGPKGKIDRVRVLGPIRKVNQVEISLYDGYQLGVSPLVRDSGDIKETPGIKIQGPKGQMEIAEGVICAARHIHMHPNDAREFGVQDGQRVKVQIGGSRGLTLDQVLIRVSEKYHLDMHIDIDEGNSANVVKGERGKLIL